jgi:hypothetical protein
MRLAARVGLGVLVAASLLPVLASESRAQQMGSAGSTGAFWRGVDAHCPAALKKLRPYPWPLKPFHRQHPVRGYFGDPRTVVFAPGCVVNPLAPGHLAPYVDATVPTVSAIFFRDLAGRALAASRLRGYVQPIAEAQDAPALAAPGVWQRMPVAPALVTWRLATVRDRRVLGGTAADFRLTEPPQRDFCSVYAPGTTQNFAAEYGRYRWGRAGTYLFELANGPLDTRLLENGRYLLTVVARDTAGNTARRTIAVIVRNHAGPQPAQRPLVDERCISRSLTIRQRRR